MHIACRARQSNIVGVILDIYRGTGRNELVDQIDKLGRSALHYAVISGRFETVKLLLEAGADVNLKDIKKCAPLAMSVGVKSENLHWTQRYSSQGYIDAAYVTLNDIHRPPEEVLYNSATNSDMSSEAQTVGVREIVRALIGHGADISIFQPSDQKNSYGYRRSLLLKQALAVDFEVLVDELLNITESHYLSENWIGNDSKRRHSTSYEDFQEKYVRLRVNSCQEMLEGIVMEGENDIKLFQFLLRTENEAGILQLQRLGADFIKPNWNGESCLTTLARWGYASLLEKVGGSQAAIIDEPWIKDIEKTDVNLPGRLKPILHVACERGLPNLEVLKVLVEKLGVDIDSRCKKDGGMTALHLLARSRHWWHGPALEYLVERGADVEIKDDSGRTCLHIAVSSQNKRAVEILLANGANANALDSEGKSCLNEANASPAIAHLLIRYGANISAGKRPYIFDAIESMDLETVDLLIDMNADCNVRPTPDKLDDVEEEDEFNLFSMQRQMWASLMDVSESSYPIHFAAQMRFNSADTKSKMVPIIKSLLRGGADPLLPFNDAGDPVLHQLCGSEGIIQPFLDASHIDLEARDPQGKTPLLAACASPQEWQSHSQGSYPRVSNARLLFEAGVDVMAVDNAGRNVLHHLLYTDDDNNDDRSNSKPIFELFLSQPKGAMLAIQRDKKGFSPLHYALKTSAIWAIDLLLETGADPREPDPDGNCALHHLCSQFSSPLGVQFRNGELVIEKFKQFLSLGLDINARNSIGQTPIFNFFIHTWQYFQHLQTLSEAGADFKAKDNRGQGLLHVIAKKPSTGLKDSRGFDVNRNPQVEIFKWLMEMGLGIDEDTEQRTPLDIAAASGNMGILELFKRTR